MRDLLEYVQLQLIQQRPTKYRDAAQHFNDRWPRTAVVLCSHAETLEHHARRRKPDAERRRQGLDP